MSTVYLNLYMIYGGTNWGGIAYPGVYTSYDYVRTLELTLLYLTTHPRLQGAAIAEDRTLREKYYELKLQANFLRVSPAYLTTRPMNLYSNQGAFTGNSALVTTQVLDVVGKMTGFYVVRWVSPLLVALMVSYVLTPVYQKAVHCILRCGGGIYPNPPDKQRESDRPLPRRTARARRQGFKDSRCRLHCRFQPSVVLYRRNHDLVYGLSSQRETCADSNYAIGQPLTVATSSSSTETLESFTKRHSNFTPPPSQKPRSFQGHNPSRPKPSIRRVSLFST